MAWFRHKSGVEVNDSPQSEHRSTYIDASGVMEKVAGRYQAVREYLDEKYGYHMSPEEYRDYLRAVEARANRSANDMIAEGLAQEMASSYPVYYDDAGNHYVNIDGEWQPAGKVSF